MIGDFSGRYRFSSGALEDPEGSFLWEHHCVAASLGPVPPARVIDEYRNRGLSFVEELTDETSFVLWDSESATLVCARDRYGARPLFLRREAEGWSFATSIRALQPRRLDVSAVLRHFAGAPSPTATCFDGIEALAPSTSLVLTQWGSRLRKIEPRVRFLGDLREALEVSVRERIPNGSFACALSGGVDSAVILALARGKAYTLAPRNADYSEVDAARRTAQHLGLEPVCVPIEESQLVEALPQVVAAAQAPLFNLHAVSKFLLARRVHADGIAVLLAGEGADERVGEIPSLREDRDLGEVLAPGLKLPNVAEKFLETVFPVSVLQTTHGVCAANGVEVRFPYLDRRIHATAEERRDKATLRAVARRLLPAEIADRPKRPRLAPPIDFFAKYLRETELARLGFLRPDEVLRLYERFRKDPTDGALDRALMRIVTLSLLVERCVG